MHSEAEPMHAVSSSGYPPDVACSGRCHRSGALQNRGMVCIVAPTTFQTIRVAMKNDYLGVAVIGAGRIGTLRARLAAKHPAVRYVAISDADPARAKALADQAGAQFHSGDNRRDHRASGGQCRHRLDAGRRARGAGVQGAGARQAGAGGKADRDVAEGCRHDPRDARSGPAATCASATAGATRSASCAPRSR